MLIAIGLLLILALTALTGYFVAQEFGYVAADRNQLARAAQDGDRRAAKALKVTERLSFMLSGAQLGITVTALLVGYVAEPYLGRGLAELFGLAGMSRAASLSIAVALALIISTIVQMVLGELGPKNLGIARPEALARALAPTTLVYLAVAGPVIRLFDAAANRILRRVGVEPAEELEEGATPEDLLRIVANSSAGGLIDEQLSILLDRGLDFRLRTAAEVMTPRVDVITIAAHEPSTRVVELLPTGRSRFPVLGDREIDDIVGVVAVSDLLQIPPEERATTPVADVARPALLIPEGMKLRHVLERLRSEHRQLACVVDEYGSFAGVITLEDVAEELVGPIRDEDDPPEAEPRRQPDGSWLVPARWRVDEIADVTGIALRPHDPTKASDTLSGLLLIHLGRVPKIGDEVWLPLEPATAPDGAAVRARVVSIQRHVAETVRLSVDEPGPGAAP